MPRKLTVLQLLPNLNMGGVERGTLEIGKHLVANGHRSLVVSGGGKLVAKLLEEGSEHFELAIGKKSLLSFRHTKALRNIIKQNKVDIIHVRSRFPAWVNYFAFAGLPKTQRPKLVSTVHGAYSVNVYSGIMMHADRIIAISEYIRSYILENYPKTGPEKITLVHRGLDTSKYNFDFVPSSEWHQSWLQQHPNSEGKKILLLPGRITRLKGQMDFIQLIARLKQLNQTKIYGLIVGGVDPRKQKYFEQLKSETRRLSLEDDIAFLGSRDDLRELMAISSITYSLSNQPEAFGRTVIESLSLNTPVIAYSHGGAKEILSHLYTQGMTRLGDINSLVNKTLEVLEQPQTIKTNQAFTLDKMLKNTLNVYQELAG